MGAWKRMMEARHNGPGAERSGGHTVESVAEKLGGEIIDGKVYAPAPGKGARDRSLCISIGRNGDLFVYDAPNLGLAWKIVREVFPLTTASAEHLAKRTEMAELIWGNSKPLHDGDRVCRYLSSRCINLRPATLRHAEGLYHSRGLLFPGMVARVTDVNDRQTALHITFLSNTGVGKADVDPERKFIGPVSGSAVRLGPASRRLIVGEGIETCLSAQQEMGWSSWAALSAPGVRSIRLPETVKEVLLLADGDDAGRNACLAASKRFQAEGRKVRLAKAPKGKDFNDLLIEKHAGSFTQ